MDRLPSEQVIRVFKVRLPRLDCNRDCEQEYHAVGVRGATLYPVIRRIIQLPPPFASDPSGPSILSDSKLDGQAAGRNPGSVRSM
jgi:hypothetical protein